MLILLKMFVQTAKKESLKDKDYSTEMQVRWFVFLCSSSGFSLAQ